MIEAEGAGIDFHPLELARLSELPEAAVAVHGGPISCARLVVAELLPEVDRCLYLDADTLTVSSLEPLLSVDLEGAPLAAVRNVVAPPMRPRLEAFDLDDPLRYLNSGILLMNLEYLRRHRGSDALLGFIRERADTLLWVDQDALNSVFAGQWVELHPRWNAQNSFWRWRAWSEETFGASRLREALERPAIIHFEGPSLSKPWHYLSAHAYRHEYRAVLATTPWGEVELEDRTPVTRALRLLPWTLRLRAYLRLIQLREKTRSRTL
jgi:lipopolysaccharide biosynthesis glycosyltransferase